MTIATTESTTDFRRVITAITMLSDLDAKLAQCHVIDYISDNFLLHCNAIQTYAKEHNDLSPKMVQWAKDCAGKCQIRITEIQQAKNAKKIAKSVISTDFATQQANKNHKREVELVTSLTPEELDKHLETSGSVQLIARKVRRARKSKPKSTPEQLEKARARYYRNKKKKAPETPQPSKLSPSHKFERYWTQEEKLLRQFFSTSDLSVIEGYWIREFQAYRMEAEAGTRERNEALAKLKNTTARETDAGASDGK